MVRPYPGSRSARTARNRRTKRIVTLLIFGALTTAFALNFFGKNKPRTAGAYTDTEIQNLIDSAILTYADAEPDTEVDNEIQRYDYAPSAMRPQPQSMSSQVQTPPSGQYDLEAFEPMTENPPPVKFNDANVIETRNKLNSMLQDPAAVEPHTAVKDQLSQLAEKWLFSRTVYPGDTLCENYRVRPGDVFSAIGREHKVPYEILLKINGITSPTTLRADDTIKVINGPFHARIYRSSFTMDLYLRDMFVRSFAVGLGREGRETPTGLWRVKTNGKLVEPSWTDPETNRTYHAGDPDYPLGSRWIGLEGLEGNAAHRTGFAIHGTTDNQSVGRPGSRGCIRMHDNDAILLYNLLTPGLSHVHVTD